MNMAYERIPPDPIDTRKVYRHLCYGMIRKTE